MADHTLNVNDIYGNAREINLAGRDIFKAYMPEQVSVLVTQLTSKLQPKPCGRQETV